MTKSEVGKEERFPPLSTTLEHLIVEGSDRKFRQTIHGLLTVSALMLRTRELFGAYIGITAPQYSMLMVIAEAGETTVGQVSELLRTSSPFVTAEIKKLVALGYVAKRQNETDRRSTLLSLTELGRTRILQVSPMRRMANDLIFGSLNPDEAAMFQHLIQVMTGDFEAAVHALEAPRWKIPVTEISP